MNERAVQNDAAVLASEEDANDAWTKLGLSNPPRQIIDDIVTAALEYCQEGFDSMDECIKANYPIEQREAMLKVSNVLYNQWFAAVEGYTDKFMNDALSSAFGLSKEEVNQISHPTAPVTDRSATEDIATEIGKSDESALLELVEKADSRLHNLRKQVDVLEEREREARDLQAVKDLIDKDGPKLEEMATPIWEALIPKMVEKDTNANGQQHDKVVNSSTSGQLLAGLKRAVRNKK